VIGLTAEERRREVNRRKNIKRRSNDVLSEPYTLAEIAARDSFRCGLCHRKVSMSLSGLHPKGPTIDHIIPLSISRDDRRANVQLAHRICNTRKNVRAVGEQLLLIG
jgi:5-methylcytosine-specific restriction endonuclease McrA